MNNFQTARENNEIKYVGKPCVKNKEHIINNKTIRYTGNSECVACSKERTCYTNNKKYYLDYKKEYNKRPHVRERIRKYDAERRKTINWKLHNAMSCSVRSVLGSKKRYRKWEQLTGYTKQDLLKHLESLFDENMTFGNYGTYWEIDHVIPKSLFHIENAECNEFKECWNLSNLQPLRCDLNKQKGNRFIG
jgi:hypothetical protein